MSFSDLVWLASIVRGVTVLSPALYGVACAIVVAAGVAGLALFRLTRRTPGTIAAPGRYPSAPIFQDHLEVIIRVNDWVSEGNRGEDAPSREDFLRMPSKTIETLVHRMGYFGYTTAIRKLYFKNEARINSVLHRTHPNSEERNSAMNAILAEVLLDLARQANVKIPQRN